MTVVLVVSLEIARALHAGGPTPVRDAVRAAGGSLSPMPAFTPGEVGERSFVVTVNDGGALCARLRALDGVEACYEKPEDAPP
jgi:hypothetical protein